MKTPRTRLGALKDLARGLVSLALLAGFSGGCMSTDGGGKPATGGYGTVTRGREVANYQGSMGEPVVTRGSAPGVPNPSLFRKYGSPSAAESRSR